MLGLFRRIVCRSTFGQNRSHRPAIALEFNCPGILSDGCFNQADWGVSRRNAHQPEPGRFKKLREFGSRTLFASPGKYQHFDVEHFRWRGFGKFGHSHFTKEDATRAGCHFDELLAHQRKNPAAALVVPIVDDVLHDVGIAAFRDPFEKAARLEIDAAVRVTKMAGGRCARKNLGKVEENAMKAGELLQDPA